MKEWSSYEKKIKRFIRFKKDKTFEDMTKKVRAEIAAALEEHGKGFPAHFLFGRSQMAGKVVSVVDSPTPRRKAKKTGLF